MYYLGLSFVEVVFSWRDEGVLEDRGDTNT